LLDHRGRETPKDLCRVIQEADAYHHARIAYLRNKASAGKMGASRAHEEEFYSVGALTTLRLISRNLGAVIPSPEQREEARCYFAKLPD